MEHVPPPNERLVNLCFVLHPENISLDACRTIFRKRKRFQDALRLSDEVAGTVSGLSDETLTAIIGSIEPHTVYMSPEQAASFLSQELEAYTRRS